MAEEDIWEEPPGRGRARRPGSAARGRGAGQGRGRGATSQRANVPHGADRVGMGSLRSVVVRAIEEATSRGSRTVEAEDVLLALSSAGSPETRQTLAAAGLDHDSLLAALEAERLHNLAYLGIDPDLARQEPTAPRSGRPVWGTSVREALSRSHSVAGRAARNRRMSERDAIIGILLANFGTLPRALTLAGVQRDALIGALQRQNHP